MENLTTLTVTDFVADEGTIWVFKGDNEDGARVTFGTDWRPGRDILTALMADEPVTVSVPDYLIMYTDTDTATPQCPECESWEVSVSEDYPGADSVLYGCANCGHEFQS